MKRFLSLIFFLSITTISISAQEDAVSAATFTGSLTLWVAIIIGFLTTIATLTFAYRLQGGIVGQSLMFIGVGMFFVVIGFLAVVVQWANAEVQQITHDLVFILGYVLMLMGALRLRQLA